LIRGESFEGRGGAAYIDSAIGFLLIALLIERDV